MSLKGFKLQTALEHVQLPVPNRKRMVARAEMFHDLINSYGGEPDDDDMERAHGLLEIGDALKSAIGATNEEEG